MEGFVIAWVVIMVSIFGVIVYKNKKASKEGKGIGSKNIHDMDTPARSDDFMTDPSWSVSGFNMWHK